MKVQRIQTIDNVEQIPFNKDVIISGSFGSCWLWKMKGQFKKKNDKLVFIDFNNCLTEYNDNEEIHLSVFKEVV